MKKHKLVFVVGARPNFMKVAPLLRLLGQSHNFSSSLVHTGQHYDDELSGRFIRDLGLSPPDHYLAVGSGSHAQQTAEVMRRIEPVLILERAKCLVVVGDVNSTMAAALVAVKLRLPVVHVEAGLRSFDREMPEEINRIVTDAVSDVLLITEESARRNLQREGIAESRIHFVGNLMIDSLRHNLVKAQESSILFRLRPSGRPFGLVTLHRPGNVDCRQKFDEILEALAEISQALPLLFPVHPRTRASLTQSGRILPPSLTLLDPLGYLDFLHLMSHSSLVLTDSGGIQEETTVLGVPCLTIRDNTERPVTIEEGTNTLAGTRRSTILAAWEQVKTHPKTGRIPPLWDGGAANRCLAILSQYFASSSDTALPSHPAGFHLPKPWQESKAPGNRS